VYKININDNIFITKEVLNKLLNGEIINKTIIKIDVAVNKHIFFVESVNIVTLKVCFGTI
jgi:hypothetical protein